MQRSTVSPISKVDGVYGESRSPRAGGGDDSRKQSTASFAAPVAGSQKSRSVLTIRRLIVILSILYIGGATAFSWGAPYHYALRNVHEVTGGLLEEAKSGATALLGSYLERAQRISHRTKALFETGALEKGMWRETLEAMTGTVGANIEVGAITAAVRFTDNTIVAVRNCGGGGLWGCSSPDVMLSNGTHLSFYSGTNRGQPLELLSREPAPRTLTGMYEKVLASPTLTAWNDLSRVTLKTPTWADSDRIAFEYASGIRPRPRISSLVLGVPSGVPNVSEAPAPLSGLSDDPGPMLGISVVSVGVGTISAYIARTRPSALIFVTSSSGHMVAVSTNEQALLMDEGIQPVYAGNSPSALVRAIFQDSQAKQAPDRGEFFTVVTEGRKHLYTKGPGTAVVLGAYIARPLEELHSSLTVVQQTLSRMTSDLLSHTREGDSSAKGPASTLSLSLAPAPATDPGGAGAGPGPDGPRRPSAAGLALAAGLAPRPPPPGGAGPAGSTRPAPGGAVAAPLQSALAELSRFQPLLLDVHARFAAFAGLLSRETEIRVGPPAPPRP
eukprot:tig00000145_g8821.t1